jgi:NADH-quinone oxidoreductase subunit N
VSYAQGIDYAAIAPPVVVAVGAAGTLLLDLATPRARRLLPVLAIGTFLAALAALAGSAAADSRRGTFCTGTRCSYALDDFTIFLQAFFCLVGVVIVLLCASTVEQDRMPAGEFFFLLLTSFAGMLTLAGGRDLLVLLLALEVVTLPALVLVGLRRADPRASEAALKFFLISVMSTAITVYGMSLLYGVTGGLQLGAISAGLARGPNSPVAAAAVLLVVAGFAFKVAAVPFHGWAPDTYQGASVPVAAYLSVASKAAGFAGLILVLDACAAYAGSWRPVLAVLAAATMTVGNLAALRQQHVIRLLAWSSIAQAGYILLPLAVPDAGPALAYLGAYAVMNLGAFGCAAAVAARRPRSAVADYRGLFSDSPLLALALAFFLTCLAGLPPGLIGLIAKVVVFRSAVTGNLVWLAVVMAVNTVVALYYYVRLAAVLFEPAAGTQRLTVPAPVAAAVAMAAAAAVALGFWPQALLGVVPGLS